MHEIRTEIEIDAPIGRVWAALSDFASYPSWNPFIPQLEGAPDVGSRLAVTIAPPGRKTMTFRPTLLEFAPETRIRWLGRLWISGLFDGEHVHTLEALPAGGTRYRQTETFRGLLVGLARGTLKSTEEGFGQMNRALKARVEGTSV